MIDESFWERITAIATGLYPHAIEEIKRAIPDIGEDDMRFLLLKCIRFPELLVCIYTRMANTRSVENRTMRLCSKICPDQKFEDWLQQFSALEKIKQKRQSS